MAILSNQLVKTTIIKRDKLAMKMEDKDWQMVNERASALNYPIVFERLDSSKVSHRKYISQCVEEVRGDLSAEIGNKSIMVEAMLSLFEDGRKYVY